MIRAVLYYKCGGREGHTSKAQVCATSWQAAHKCTRALLAHHSLRHPGGVRQLCLYATAAQTTCGWVVVGDVWVCRWDGFFYNGVRVCHPCVGFQLMTGARVLLRDGNASRRATLTLTLKLAGVGVGEEQAASLALEAGREGTHSAPPTPPPLPPAPHCSYPSKSTRSCVLPTSCTSHTSCPLIHTSCPCPLPHASAAQAHQRAGHPQRHQR